jgi:large subunit ribosomal protein L9
MKLILLQNVPKLGKKNDIVEVKNGYARNYLLPERFALPATKKSLENIEDARKKEMEKRARIVSKAEELKELIGKTKLVLEREVSEKSRLFGSVNEKEIRTALSKEIGHTLSSGMIQLAQPIKNTGSFAIPVVLTDSMTVNFTLQIKKAK